MIPPPRERRQTQFLELELFGRDFLLNTKRRRARKSSASTAAKNSKKKAAAKKKPLTAEARRFAGLMTREESTRAGDLFRAGRSSHKWLYWGAGKWNDYAAVASENVELAFAAWQVNPHVDVRSVQSGDWDYMVDFNLMQQTNIKHPSHKVRPVSRVAKGDDLPPAPAGYEAFTASKKSGGFGGFSPMKRTFTAN